MKKSNISKKELEFKGELTMTKGLFVVVVEL